MTATLTTLISFNGTDGEDPEAGLILDASGDLFGATASGSGGGKAFEIEKTSSGYASAPTLLATFSGLEGDPDSDLLADAEGDLFGTTRGGGTTGEDRGSVFEVVKSPSGYADPPGILLNFMNANGAWPEAVTADANGDLFGITQAGGASNDGVLFEIAKTGAASTLITFDGANGDMPDGGLLVDANGDLFGTTYGGGANLGGTVFELVKTATGYASTPTVLATLAEDAGSDGPLIMDANGDLFGTSGASVFELVKSATGYTLTTLASFPADTTPTGGVIMDANGNLFGMTGFLLNQGTVFEIKKTAIGYASAPTTLVSFNITDNPSGGLVADSSGNLFGTTSEGGANYDGTVFEITGSGFVPGSPARPAPSIGDLVPAIRLTTLVSFHSDEGYAGPDFQTPSADLFVDSHGDLFGAANSGGAGTAANPAEGGVFEILKTNAGYASAPTTLATYRNAQDAGGPYSGLISDANGDLFGTTITGGANGDGSVFEIVKTASGYDSTPKTLVSFNYSTTGASPQGGLLADANGDLFGTTYLGGGGSGTVFEVKRTAAGYASAPTTLVSLVGADGGEPVAGLMADSNGDLFGTTELGGLNAGGTVFEIKKTAAGYASTPTVLVNFGAVPVDRLIADSRGDLFLTTKAGGQYAYGAVYEIAKTASGYASTPILLASFDQSEIAPKGSLIADANGDLFGTLSGDNSALSGVSSDGAVFEIKKTATGYDSTPIILHAFDGADGSVPLGSLIADASGNLLGTTAGGGANGGGTIFEITDSGFVPGPWVATPPAPESILLRNTGNGRASLWEMNGSTLIGGGTVTTNLSSLGWNAIGTGDFNDDTLPDILWQDPKSGRLGISDMNGITQFNGQLLDPIPGPGSRVVGTGDFNGDHLSDILWQNANTGQASIWETANAPNDLLGGGPVTPNPGPAWKAIGTGDFNKDGKSDILWQNANTGQVSIWEMDGTKLIGGGAVTPNPGTAWQAIGTGDFNQDSHFDILFQNKNTGQISVWEMDGTSLIGGGPVSANPGTSWHAIGTGAGGSDILLQNTNGRASIWDMDGNTITGGGPVSPNPGPNWRAVGLT